MIKKIKDLTKNYLTKKGFKLIREEEYIEFIKGSEELYKKSIFKDLPNSNGQREKLMSKLIGTGVHEAFHLLYYLNQSLEFKGDICEFGVAQGATSALIANEILDTSKKLWLFDSFKGLPKPTKKDELKDDIFNLGTMDKYEGSMSNPVNLVKKRLKEINFPFEKVKIVPGYIKKDFQTSSLPPSVCFAYLDFDFYEPTLIVLNNLNKVLSVGGHVVIDDYDFFSTGIKSAVQEFLKANKEQYEFILPFKEAGHFCILKKIA